MTLWRRCGHNDSRTILIVSSSSLLVWTLLAAILVNCFGPYAQAKTQAGISGIVTDSTGAVMSGVIVEATSKETGIVEKRQTNTDGFYAFLDLPPGHYDLTVQQSGFNEFRQTGILLDVDSAKVINVKLKVGNVTEQVQVSGEAGRSHQRRDDDVCSTGEPELYRSPRFAARRFSGVLRSGGWTGRTI
jgi:Carboxypeptidase regulatory-like domain